MKHRVKLFCSRCGALPRRSGQRWCNPCFATYNRAHRPKYADLSPVGREKQRVRRRSARLVERGVLAPQPCCITGCPWAAEKHHPDYGDPQGIKWICRRHHLELHRTGGCTDPAELLARDAEERRENNRAIRKLLAELPESPQAARTVRERGNAP